MENQKLFDTLKDIAAELGAFRSAILPASEVVTDRVFRELCKNNSCGVYGKCYTCPPDVGEIDDLIADLYKRQYMFFYQTVTELEDSFDIEGMQLAKKKHVKLALALRERCNALELKNALHLQGGGCGVCKVCAKRTDEPCRFPDKAISSLEAYGIYVSKTAEKTDMKYINGQDTVTYFGAVFFDF